MSSRASRRVIFAALAANAAIAISKYTAAAITGSSAMLAEAFHSTADTGNELLLLIGMKRSRLPADSLHPFGHGKLLYFYALLVAVYIFAVGAGLAAYEAFVIFSIPNLPRAWAGAMPYSRSLPYSISIPGGFLTAKFWLAKIKNESTWDEVVRQ